MSICSISSFYTALLLSDQYISSPRDIRANLASLTRTKHFVECEAMVGDRPALIHAPISTEALRLMENLEAILTDSSFGEIAIYHNVLAIEQLSRVESSLIVQLLPEEFTPLREALCFNRRSTLMSGLKELEERFRRYGISHNNLRIDNIIIDPSGQWHPMRLYYATRDKEGDAAAFKLLREAIDESAMSDDLPDISCTKEELSSYNTREPLIEDRRRFHSEHGVGFLNARGEVAIEPIYAWANNFCEDRAEVMDKSGRMGLIDRHGRTIIPIDYDDVRFNVDSATVWVCQEGLWAEFDYDGTQLGEWSKNEGFMVDEVSGQRYASSYM